MFIGQQSYLCSGDLNSRSATFGDDRSEELFILLDAAPGGVAAVSRQVGRAPRSLFVSPGMRLRPAVVNGAARVVVTADRRPVTVIGFTIADDKIVEIDAISDPQRLPTIAAALLAND